MRLAKLILVMPTTIVISQRPSFQCAEMFEDKAEEYYASYKTELVFDLACLQ